MAVKHKVTINVSDESGKKSTVLRGANLKLPARIIRFLFGDFTQVYLLKPGQTVEFCGCQRNQGRRFTP